MKTNNIIIVAIIFSLFSCESKVKTISVKDLKQVLTQDDIQLIDVRTPGEYSEGHIKNSRLMNVNSENFKEIAIIGLDKTKPVYVYCKMGGRGSKAAKILHKEGFTKVYNLKGGYMAWKTQQ